MRIVVDAMGSDNHPAPDVAGTVLAAREANDTFILVGDEQQIRTELAKHDTTGLSIEVNQASQAIAMTDKPTVAAKEKPDSSMHIGLAMVKEGKADAFVTAGNTGAVLTIATLYTLKRIKGVKRPAITTIFPNLTGRVVAADIGANADCRPEYLTQFAVMASIYAKKTMGIDQPRVALLSNGEEEGKGNDLVKKTIPLMRELSSINYVGNMEPKEVLSGETDVVIHDGFTGNVFIKSIEAAAGLMKTLLKEEITSGTITKVGGALARPALDRVSLRLDPDQIGGAPLLGVDGIVIIGHGRSNDIAIKNAINQAQRAVAGGVIDAIREQL